MADGLQPDPQPERVSVDLSAEQEAAVRRVTGLSRPGDREPGPDDLLAALDAQEALTGAVVRLAADDDTGPWDD